MSRSKVKKDFLIHFRECEYEGSMTWHGVCVGLSNENDEWVYDWFETAKICCAVNTDVSVF